jgi:hypothetical protein
VGVREGRDQPGSQDLRRIPGPEPPCDLEADGRLRARGRRGRLALRLRLRRRCGLVLFAVTFVPALVLFLLGFLAMLTPLTGWLSNAVRDRGRRPAQHRGGRTAVARRPPGGAVGHRPAAPDRRLARGALRLAGRRGGRDPAGNGRARARRRRPGGAPTRQRGRGDGDRRRHSGVPGAPPRRRGRHAAAAGWDASESYVVVGRRVLDEFERDATQGLLAHLVGSIGNGDLRGAAQIHSLLYVLELMTCRDLSLAIVPPSPPAGSPSPPPRTPGLRRRRCDRREGWRPSAWARPRRRTAASSAPAG